MKKLDIYKAKKYVFNYNSLITVKILRIRVLTNYSQYIPTFFISLKLNEIFPDIWDDHELIYDSYIYVTPNSSVSRVQKAQKERSLSWFFFHFRSLTEQPGHKLDQNKNKILYGCTVLIQLKFHKEDSFII